MFRNFAITHLALTILALSTASAQAQFAPAVGPPPGGFVPTGPSQFPPLTMPQAPPGWVTNPAPATGQYQVFNNMLYYRSSPNVSWQYLGPASSAATMPQPQGHQHVYVVYSRPSPNAPWRQHGSYLHKGSALGMVNFLRTTGHEAYYQ